MHPLFTKDYFPQFLDLSIEIFHKRYPLGETYRDHLRWNEYIELLRNTGVKKILICAGEMVGDISRKYFCFPMTENSPSEEQVREKNFVVEEITL